MNRWLPRALIVLTGSVIADFEPQPEDKLAVAVPDGTFSVEMKDGTRFAGKPVSQDDVPITAAFGKIRVPLKLIKGFEPLKSADGKTGIVKVTILPGMPAYAGSTQNGVTSSSYGGYSFSYKVEPLNNPRLLRAN